MSELSKLKWQCRRGTLELDILLTRYLETYFNDAGREEQAGFMELLKLEDTELMLYLMGDHSQKLENLVLLAKKIRDLSPRKV